MVDVIQDDTRRKAVVADTVDLIAAEVSRKKGVTGMALKAGYKVVSKLKGGRMVSHAANLLLDDMAAALEPLHAAFRESGEGDFSAFLDARGEEATEALLSVTDSKAEGADKGVLLKTYRKLRPTAVKHVREAIPGLGTLIQAHTA